MALRRSVCTLLLMRTTRDSSVPRAHYPKLAPLSLSRSYNYIQTGAAQRSLTYINSNDDRRGEGAQAHVSLEIHADGLLV